MSQVEKRNRKEFIISISKEFSVTSKFTSFVAIEHREKVNSGDTFDKRMFRLPTDRQIVTQTDGHR